jgi:hypothetical protein
MYPPYTHIRKQPTGWTKQEALESLVRKAGYNVSKISCVPLAQHNSNGKQSQHRPGRSIDTAQKSFHPIHLIFLSISLLKQTPTTQGKLTEAFWGRVSVTRYQSSKATVTYADFLLASSFGSGSHSAAATRPGAGAGSGSGKRIQIS